MLCILVYTCVTKTYSHLSTHVYMHTCSILIASWNVVTKMESLVISLQLSQGVQEIDYIHTARQAQ